MYFLQNRQTEGYMQVDDDDAPNYTNNGGIMEIHPQDGENCQRWDLFYLGDGYYRMESAVSGYAVTVPAGDETDLMGYSASTSGIAASVSSLTFSEEELAEIASRMPTFTYERKNIEQ